MSRIDRLGDLDANGNDIKDSDDPNVSVGTGVTIGRNEIDLIKIVLRKRDSNATLSGNVILQVPDNVRLWKKPIKVEAVSVTAGEIFIPATDLASPITFFVEATSPSVLLKFATVTAP